MLEGAHLVGSIPLGSTKRAMETAASAIGGWLRSIPDGETGERINWVECQYDVFRLAKGLEADPDEPGYETWPNRFRIAHGVDVSEVQFGSLSYAAAAVQSYSVYLDLRERGLIGSDTRFQVSLPTPLAAVKAFASARDMAVLEQTYERTLRAEIDTICQRIPTEHLAFQFDVCWEIEIIECCTPRYWSNDCDDRDESAARVARIAAAVPDGVELGFHLCYGDYEHRHFMQPASTAVMVDLANRIAARLARPINWLHLPVPQDRDDIAYFAPLSELTPPERLYLGLVHHDDGVEGARRRAVTAAKVVNRFGVATECGMGRTPPQQVPALFTIIGGLLA
jgi:hypothetical protein